MFLKKNFAFIRKYNKAILTKRYLVNVCDRYCLIGCLPFHIKMVEKKRTRSKQPKETVTDKHLI